MTATLPLNAAARLSNCSFSYSLEALSDSVLISAICCSTADGLPAPSIIVVSSLPTITLRAEPSTSRPAFSNVKPRSSEITVAPVKIAISRKISLRRSPKLGALTATVLNTPFSLFSTKILSASPSTSSAISTTSFLPLCANFSSIGRNSCTLEIFLSVIKIAGFSYTASCRPVSVTKNGLTQPLSKLKPSTTSASNSKPWPASTVTTPSLPTFSMTLAINLPISASPAEMVATSATRSDFPSIGSASVSS